MTPFELSLRAWKDVSEQQLVKHQARLDEINVERAKITSEISKIENHVFNFIYSSTGEAEMEVDSILRDEANDSCGDGFVGPDSVSMQYIVGETMWEATAQVEYNRHDKRFYYVDYFDIAFKELGPYAD